MLRILVAGETVVGRGLRNRVAWVSCLQDSPYVPLRKRTSDEV
jgi:hypothetical protein